MQIQGLSQERLKLIACITMLLDHVGATVVLECFYETTGESKAQLLQVYEVLRTVGRLAFPIYCFLLAEGAYHTLNPNRYALRLFVGAVLAEIPYDLALYGEIAWNHQSVMVTLLLGFLMLEVIKKTPRMVLKLLAIVPFALLADQLSTDYGSSGILVIALFALTRELPYRGLLQFLCIWCIFSPNHLMALNWLGGFSVTIQELAAFAVLPIALYSGQKSTSNKAVQWAFYLFYPVHLMVLYLVGTI